MTIKSITAVRAHGAGNNGNWVARMRMNDGSELFGGVGGCYTLHQVQNFIQSNPTNCVKNHALTGEPEEAVYQPLPAGVTVSVE